MKSLSLFGSKIILALFNCFLLICGFLLAIGGMLTLFDTEKLTISKLLFIGEMSNLPQPFLYYLSIAISLLGLIIAATGILGCWASCLHNYCLLTFYFVMVLFLLIGECAIYTVAWAWPGCIGIGLDSQELVQNLQRNYGAVGKQAFTTSVDLIQTKFKCCGIDSANEYDTSLWRLQSPKPQLAIPLSCCRITNIDQPKAYLTPQPENLQLCQALEQIRHVGYRYVTGCRESLEQWFRFHYIIFLTVGFTVILIQFLVLLSTVLTCTRVYHYNQELKVKPKKEETEVTSEVTYRKKKTSPVRSYSNETYDVREENRYYQPRDLERA